MGKYKHKFDKIKFRNRWKIDEMFRPDDWNILGLSKRWTSNELFRFSISFFGLEILIWIKRLWVNTNTN